MEVLIGFGIAAGIVVLGLFVWWVVLLTQPRASVRDVNIVEAVRGYGTLPNTIPVIPTHPTASNIGKAYVLESRGATGTNIGITGYPSFPGVAFVSGNGRVSTIVGLPVNNTDQKPFSTTSSSTSSSSVPVVRLHPTQAHRLSRTERKSRRSRKARNARNARR